MMRDDGNSNFTNKYNGGSTIRRHFHHHSPAKCSLIFLFYLSLFFGAFVFTRLFHSSLSLILDSPQRTILTAKTFGNFMHPDDKNSQVTKTIETYTNPVNKSERSTETIDGHIIRRAPGEIEFPLDCSVGDNEGICPTNYPKGLKLDPHSPPPPTCPDYFRWIYEDLRPWSETGITPDIIARSRRTANFKLVILDGRAYIERYEKSFQTRDVFTLWGIVQLLRKYPGRVPDLELMFDCVDWPVLLKRFFDGPNVTIPPPLFRYCGDDNTFDIVFPDWSFWGWAEIGIKPWEILSKELQEGNKRKSWIEREPYAYWKGNPFVAPSRIDLLKCNISDKMDWRTRVYIQDWNKEVQQGFKNSDLASQCIHRYKIYIEGSAWSVSEKYILACDSVPLIVKPRYYDFFSRGLMPMQHYWPVNEKDKCISIKHAVEWGDNHMQKAEGMGKTANNYIHNDVKMDNVYDYMLHLLTEYAKLLKYKPKIPSIAVELCSETLACSASDLEKKFMMDSLVKGPSNTEPCTMPPPYERSALQDLLKRKRNTERQVEMLEKAYWANQNFVQ